MTKRDLINEVVRLRRIRRAQRRAVVARRQDHRETVDRQSRIVIKAIASGASPESLLTEPPPVVVKARKK